MKHKMEKKKIEKAEDLRINGKTPTVLAKKVQISNAAVTEFKRKQKTNDQSKT